MAVSMVERKTKSVTIRMTREDYIELEAQRLECEPNLGTSTFYRRILTGKQPHPYFRQQTKILDDLVVSRMEALDMFLHYASSAVAAQVLHIRGDKLIEANEEVFRQVEADMRGYTFNHKTGERTRLPKSIYKD